MDVQKNPKGMVVAGWVLSVIPAGMLGSGAYFALSGAKMVVDGMAHNGFPLSILKPMGLIELACVVLFLVPRRRFMGRSC